MNLTYSDRKFFILPAVLGVWLLLGGLLMYWIDPRTFVLVLGLLSITSVMSVVNFYRISGWLTALISLIVYILTQIRLNEFINPVLFAVILFGVILIITTIIAWFTAKQIQSLQIQLDRDQRMIEELRIKDPLTGLVRYPFAIQTLKTEVTRSRRRNTDICIILAQAGNWDTLVERYGISESENMKAKIGSIFNNSLRLEDTAFMNKAYGAILPETKPEGAIVVAQRIINQSAKNLQIDVHVGISHFPSDAVSETELVKAAEFALQNAIQSDQPISFFSQVRDSVEGEANDLLSGSAVNEWRTQVSEDDVAS